MIENLTITLTLLSLIAFGIAAVASRYQSGQKPKLIKRFATGATILSLGTATVIGILVASNGLIETPLIGFSNLGFSLRLDALSAIMYAMIALLGFIIIKFSYNYLDGDSRHGAFIGRLSATIASVQLLVLSGNLGLLLAAWILTSLSLHRLLVFYPERPGARVAAKKKFILARIGDLCLLIAFGLLYIQFDSGNLEIIFSLIKNTPVSLDAPAVFLVLAALFKSAQFPVHGWLIEVMETPTPVSALLHAGLLNAGPFLIVRMAYVIDASTIAPFLLIVVGALTALFGSITYLTQTSVKTALGYSSISHMGFSLMVCGLGVYPAAMLHLVAHSFYKAHAFLSSGSVVDMIKGSRLSKNIQYPRFRNMALALMVALLLYALFAWLWGINLERELSLIFVGVVIIIGLTHLLTMSLNAKGSALLIQTVVMVAIITTSFFILESVMHFLLSSQLPELRTPGFGKTVVVAVILFGFALTVFSQMILSKLSEKKSFRALAIHLRNGLYTNVMFDRLIGALRIHSKESLNLIKKSTGDDLITESIESVGNR